MRVWLVVVSMAMGMALVPARAVDKVIACEREAVVRTIQIVARPSADRACEVRYQKSSSSAPAEVLWHAANDASFCTRQAETLADRLAAGGWSCQAVTEGQVHAAARQMTDVPEMPEPMSAPIEVAEPAPQGVTAATERQPAMGQVAPEASDDPLEVMAVPEGAPMQNTMFKLRPSIH